MTTKKNAGEIGLGRWPVGTHSSPHPSPLSPQPVALLKAGSEQALSGSRALNGSLWSAGSIWHHREQVFSGVGPPGESLTGTGLSLGTVSTSRASCPRGPGVQAKNDISTPAPKPPPSHWRETRGWLWLERHAISQTAYLRLSFSTHPS